MEVSISRSDDSLDRLDLEAVYQRYGEGIYIFCLRLLADKEAAESATVDTFVRFGKEMGNQFNNSRAILRLRKLAIEAAIEQREYHRGAIGRLLHNAHLQLSRLLERNKRVPL